MVKNANRLDQNYYSQEQNQKNKNSAKEKSSQKMDDKQADGRKEEEVDMEDNQSCKDKINKKLEHCTDVLANYF